MALTMADKKWIEGKFATKTDLTTSMVRQGIEFDKKIDGLKEEMNQKHDEVMTGLDGIMKEVVRGREHDLVMAHQQEVQDKRLDRLEKRVGIA